jgi:Cdc6-like AAA superfamily ATPase
MINYQTFYQLMKSISSQSSLPTLIFNPASSIGMATQGIATLLEEKDISSTRENIQCLVDQINCPVNMHHYATLTKIADAYAGKIINTFNVLGFIKTSVDSIKSKIVSIAARQTVNNTP